MRIWVDWMITPSLWPTHSGCPASAWSWLPLCVPLSPKIGSGSCCWRDNFWRRPRTPLRTGSHTLPHHWPATVQWPDASIEPSRSCPPHGQPNRTFPWRWPSQPPRWSWSSDWQWLIPLAVGWIWSSAWDSLADSGDRARFGKEYLAVVHLRCQSDFVAEADVVGLLLLGEFHWEDVPESGFFLLRWSHSIGLLSKDRLSHIEC